MEQLNSAIGKMTKNDFIKSGITAFIAGIVVALGSIVTQPGFDIFSVDWHATLNLMINAGVAALIADIVRRVSTNQDGKLFGKIG